MVKALGEIVKIVSGLEKKSKSSDCYYQHQILFFNSLTTYHFFYLLLYTPYIFLYRNSEVKISGVGIHFLTQEYTFGSQEYTFRNLFVGNREGKYARRTNWYKIVVSCENVSCNKLLKSCNKLLKSSFALFLQFQQNLTKIQKSEKSTLFFSRQFTLLKVN